MSLASNNVRSKYLKYLETGVDYCLDKLFEELSPHSYYYRDFVVLKSRYSRASKNLLNGIIDIQNQNLEINNIINALVEYFTKLTDEDFIEISTENKKKVAIVESSLNHFWDSFFNHRTTIVIGTYYSEKFRAWEASTLMGTGDALALGKMIGIFNKVGIKNYEIVPTYNFSADRYQNNLVLLGGPDANQLTREVYNKLNTKYKFGDPDKHIISLFDSIKNESYIPKYGNNRTISGDYGVIFKTANPFNIDTESIILAGCFGFGTCAAAQLFESEKMLSQVNGFSGTTGFEALVYSDVINDWTQKPSLVDSYKI